MILEFKTKGKNTYGRRKYLAIDTGAEIYTTEYTGMIIEGIEIKTADYKSLLEKLERLGYKKLERIF